MTDDARLQRLLHAAFPASRDETPARDLWPLVVNRRTPRPSPPWTDLALGVAVVVATLLLPGGWLLIAYHL